MSPGKTESIWDRLRIEGEKAGLYVRLRYPEVQACATYAARRTIDGYEAVILEVQKASIPPSTQYPESKGFNVTATPLHEGRLGAARLVLSLADLVYRDVFLTLASDVVRVLGNARTEHEAVEAFVSRLGRWQAFLRRHGPEGLSLKARRGLAGELFMLRDVLLPEIGDASVSAWRGPAGAAHDFQLPGGSLEVKCTISATPGEFRVSNVLQLDDALSNPLFLGLVLLHESESSGETLPEVIASVRSKLGGEVLGVFEDRLVDAGYLEGHLYHYTSPRYQVRSVRYFRVEGDFPRLIGSMVPDGVTQVTYTVAVAACLPHVCEQIDMLTALRNQHNHD